MTRLALWPLAYGLGAGAGALLAALLGAHGPSWGSALAFPVVSLLFAAGTWREDDGEQYVANLLRFTLAFSAGFLATTIPLTLLRLEEIATHAAATPSEAAQVARMRADVTLRWALIGLALPAGAVALFMRKRREARPREAPSL